MENQTKSPQHYTSLEEGALIDNNVLLTICEDSVESPQLLSPGGDRSDLPNALSCGLMEKRKITDCNETMDNSDFLRKGIPVQLKNKYDFFVIKKYSSDTQTESVNQTASRNAPRLIAPKLSDASCVNSAKRNFVIDSHKKRDDRRRATHNEVERRRRDKINSWIFKLKELIPESAGTSSPTDSKYKVNAADSKSQILIRACEYIKEMQEELKSLRECLMENDNLRLCNQQLQYEMDQIKSSNAQSTEKIKMKCESPKEEQSRG